MPPIDPIAERLLDSYERREVGDERRHGEMMGELRELRSSIDTHSVEAAARHTALLTALQQAEAREAAQAQAEAAERSQTTAWLRTGASEVWATMRPALGMLITGLATYWVWQLTGAAPTPTPVVTEPAPIVAGP